MRTILPIVTLLGGLFFILLPFIGSTSEPETFGNHNRAAGGISFFFGLFIAIVSGYYLIKRLSGHKR